MWVHNDVTIINQGASSNKYASERSFEKPNSREIEWYLGKCQLSAQSPGKSPVEWNVCVSISPRMNLAQNKNNASRRYGTSCVCHRIIPPTCPNNSRLGLIKYPVKTPTYHMAMEDVDVPIQPEVVDGISGHQLVQGRGSKVAVMHQTHREGTMRVARGRSVDLSFFSQINAVVLGKRCRTTPSHE